MQLIEYNQMHPLVEQNQVIKKPDEIYKEIEILTEQVADPLFNASKFERDSKEYFKWRANDGLRKEGAILCNKVDTIFHVAIHGLKNKKSSSANLQEVIEYLIGFAYDNFDTGGRSCLLSKDENGKYFWEEADDELNRYFKGLVNIGLSDYLRSKDRKTTQLKLIKAKEMCELADVLSRSKDIPNYLSKDHLFNEDFNDWKDEYFTYRALNSFEKNPLLCQQGDNLLFVAIQSFLSAKNKEEARRYIGLIFFLIRYSCRSTSNKKTVIEFLGTMNNKNEGFLSPLIKKLASFEFNYDLLHGKNNPTIEICLLAAMLSDTKNLQMLSNNIEGTDLIDLKLRAKEAFQEGRTVFCQEGDTLAHIIMRNLMDSLGHPSAVNFLLLLILLLRFANSHFSKGGKEFIEVKNAAGDTFLNILAYALLLDQRRSLLASMSVSNTTTTHTPIGQSFEIIQMDSESEEESEGEKIVSSQAEDSRTTSQMQVSVPKEYVKAEKMSEVVDSWACQLYALLFSQEPLNPAVLNYRVEETVIFLESEKQVKYKKGSSLFEILVERFISKENKSIIDVGLLISLIKFAVNRESSCLPFSNHAFKGIDKISECPLERKTILNWINISFKMNKFTPLQKKIEEMKDDEEVNDVDMCNFIENLDKLLFAEELLTDRLISNLLKWRASKIIQSLGMQIRCQKQDTLLHAVACKINNCNKVTSILSGYGALIFLIKLAIDHFDQGGAEFLKHRDEEGVAFWELLPASNGRILDTWIKNALKEKEENIQKGPKRAGKDMETKRPPKKRKLIGNPAPNSEKGVGTT